ncbi:MAG TPA: hypothetical protein VFB36_14855 [Nevskiaceae bacterium]|nr:hypothetical protein [Nevskiaceae bacterium]
MKSRKNILAITMLTALAAPTFAQESATQRDEAKDTATDARQQQRIEQGLKSGALTDQEAARLEKDEARVQKMETRDERNGKISSAEQKRIDEAQQKVSKDISAQKHDAQTDADPDSASNKRMESDVARDMRQDKRIEQGVKSGALTTNEASRLEKGEASDERAEGKAGASGGINAKEQRRIARAETRQSKRIHKEKSNGKTQ